MEVPEVGARSVVHPPPSQGNGGQLLVHNEDALLLRLEKQVFSRLLHKLFAPDVAGAFFDSLYTERVTTPLFVDDKAGSSAPMEEEESCTPHTLSAWCRFDVRNFVPHFYAKDPFPPFTVTLSMLSGSAMQQLPGAQVRVRVSVHNKWADVTAEVSPDLQQDRVLEKGSLTIGDLVFHDISVKHGGFFVVHVVSVDFAAEIVPWRSPKITVQSVKTHSNHNNKRKLEMSS